MSKVPPPKNDDDEEKKPHKDVQLKHNFNYVGGAFAYKNSSKKGKLVDPENLKKSVLIVGYGKARPVSVAHQKEDPRAGHYPQHNSPEDFRATLEKIPARSLKPYESLIDIPSLESKAFTPVIASMTRDRLRRLATQFSHLSQYAFNQMMCIATPDKRDFKVWFKPLPKKDKNDPKQTMIVYPYEKTGQTVFAQLVQQDRENHITSIRHCVFDQGQPILVNETMLDCFNNVRQIAHVGQKGAAAAINTVERFDDATVLWTVTKAKSTGSVALRPDGEVCIIGDEIGDLEQLAARNLGAEGVENDSWTGQFSLDACKAEDHPMQKAFKDQVRKQIGQIIDGATIPGLDPIFRIPALEK